MATVDGLTKERMLAIEAESITAARIDPVTEHLILTTHGGSDIDVGNVTGPTGPPGPMNPNAADLTASGLQTFAGSLATPSLKPSLSGLAIRFVGGCSGPPSYGSPQVGDIAFDYINSVVWFYYGGSWRNIFVSSAFSQKNFSATNFSTNSSSPIEIDASVRTTLSVGQSGIVDAEIVLSGAYATVINTTDLYLYIQADALGWRQCGGFPFLAINQWVTAIAKTRFTGLTPGNHTFYAGWSQTGGGTVNLPLASRGAAQAGSLFTLKGI